MNTPQPLIAVVDDEESVRRALQRLMVSAGFAVVAFGTGAEFLDSLSVRRPACVVVDLHMPGMSGFEVQARLTDAGDSLPVVIITGHDTPEARQRVLEAGAVTYLRKPIDEQVLLEAINAAIAGVTSTSRSDERDPA